LLEIFLENLRWKCTKQSTHPRAIFYVTPVGRDSNATISSNNTSRKCMILRKLQNRKNQVSFLVPFIL